MNEILVYMLAQKHSIWNEGREYLLETWKGLKHVIEAAVTFCVNDGSCDLYVKTLLKGRIFIIKYNQLFCQRSHNPVIKNRKVDQLVDSNHKWN